MVLINLRINTSDIEPFFILSLKVNSFLVLDQTLNQHNDNKDNEKIIFHNIMNDIELSC